MRRQEREAEKEVKYLQVWLISILPRVDTGGQRLQGFRKRRGRRRGGRNRGRRR